MEMRNNRKKRTDRTHIIYRLWVGVESYVGITAKTESTVLKSVHRRIGKHWSRANRENKSWNLYDVMRELSCISEIEYEIVATVRGKYAGHKFERELIKTESPTLNTSK